LADFAWWESNEELPKSKFKNFQRTSLAGLKKIAIILPFSELKFFVCYEEHEWKKSAAPIVQSYLVQVQTNNLL
jgi:hypothetical protein